MNSRLTLLLIVIAALGAIIASLGKTAILVTFPPLLLLWLMAWDEKMYKKTALTDSRQADVKD